MLTGDKDKYQDIIRQEKKVRADRMKDLEEMVAPLKEKVKGLETDVKEKAAYIEDLENEIEGLRIEMAAMKTPKKGKK